MQHTGGPFSGVAFTSPDKGLTNCLVLSLNNAICAGVIQGDVDIMDTVPVHEPVEGGDTGHAIVGDNFFNGTPPAQYVFKKKCTQYVTGLCA